MSRRVKNSLAERRLLLEAGVPPGNLDRFLWDSPTIGFHAVDRSPTGRRDTVTTNSLDLKPKSLTLEMLLETKRQVAEMEIGNYQIIPADFSQIEKRIIDSLGIPSSMLFFERPRTSYEPPNLWADQSWRNPYRTHKYEEHRQKVKAMQEAQAAERTRKSYEELFI